MAIRRLIAAACALTLSATPAGAQASFQGLGDLPGSAFQSGANGVSGDGAVVVGTGVNALEDIEPFRWAGSMVGLGFLPGGTEGAGNDVSADGSVVVGFSENSLGETEAFRWSAGGGMVGLGDLPGGVVQSIARGVSADGSTVVGEGRTATGSQAVRWSGGGPQALGDLPGGSAVSVARAASADGSVIVGAANIDGGGTYGEAFRWTASGGMVGLGTPAGYSLSIAFDVSDDGSVVVGQAVGSPGSEAFRWTEADGFQPLGDLPGGAFASRALAISADGSVIVGAGVGEGNRTDAFVWTEQDGMRSLTDILGGAGIDVSGWTLVALGVSDDGSVVVGQGTNPQGQQEAWRAVLPGVCESGLAEAYWVSPDGGAFAIGSNWLDGAVPGEEDVAVFELPDGTSYTVSFAADHVTESTSIAGGNDVHFVLGGHSYSLAGTAGECGPSLRVGNEFEPAVLTVQQGSLHALAGLEVQGAVGTEVVAEAEGILSAGGAVALAVAAESRAVVVARDGGQVALLAGNPVVVGGAGDAAMYAHAGGTVVIASPLRVGTEEGGIGLLSAVGAGAALSTTGPMDLAERGLGFLGAVEGGSIVAADVFVGREAGAVGTINVNSATTQATRILLGVAGEGLLFVEAGGVLLVPGTLAIPGGSGQGNATVSGAGAVVEAGIVTLGGSGNGHLIVGPGGFVGAEVFSALPGGQLELLFGCMRIGAVTECGPASRGGGGVVAADTVWLSPGAQLDLGGVALGAGGVLGGAGALELDLTNAGTINPGDSAGMAGTFTIGGAYAQAPAGVLESELAGAANHDVLSVTGAATLDGTLRFRYLGGFNPSPGDAFTVLTAGSVVGEFAAVEGPAGSTYSVAYGPTAVTATVLTVDEEPGPGEAGLVLHPPTPNPTAGPVALLYQLGAPGHVRLAVYDALGREVAVLTDGRRPAGSHDAILDTHALSAGRYVARLSSGADVATRAFTVTH